MALTQSTRIATLNTPLGGDTLVFQSLNISEELGRLFTLDIEAASERGDLKADDMLGKGVSVEMKCPRGGVRYFHGFVSRFNRIPMPGTHSFAYRLTAVPWLWFLTRQSGCRIFQNKTLQDILRDVFGRRGFSDFKFQLSGDYTPWEYCVQYRETDFNFVSRLMEQEGVYYYFEHEKEKHTAVFADSPVAHQPFPKYEKLTFSALTSRHEQEHVYNWVAVEELRADRETFQGGGDVTGLATGRKFTLSEGPSPADVGEYLVIDSSIDLQSNIYESGTSREMGEIYHCTFTGIKAADQFRPARITAKPVIQGLQTAVVTGPKGEEIYTDNYGRIKVQFHWDREGKHDENTTRWIRVATTWAGQNWGSISIPRIGQEVVVGFLEGDPDQPLVVGSVYNAKQMPPYNLPNGKVVSGLKSKTHKGTGYNEMSMDDTAGKEKINVHAQHDMGTTVEHNDTQTVHNNRTKTIDNDETTHVKHDRTETVDHDEKITIGNNRTEQVGVDESITVGSNRTRNVGKNETITVALMRTHTVGVNEAITVGAAQEITVGAAQAISVGLNQANTIGANRQSSVGKNDTLAVGKALTIDAGNELTITTGKASIHMKKDGTIEVSGKNITINGSGKIDVTASKNLTLKGQKILEN